MVVLGEWLVLTIRSCGSRVALATLVRRLVVLIVRVRVFCFLEYAL